MPSVPVALAPCEMSGEWEHQVQLPARNVNLLPLVRLIGRGWRTGGSGFGESGLVRFLDFFLSARSLMQCSLGYYLLAVIITTVVALVTIFHTQIVTFLRPAANWMHRWVYDFRVLSSFIFGIVSSLPGGWAIPIAIMFIISFPPVCTVLVVIPQLVCSCHSSSLVTKLSPYCVALSGVYGLALVLLLLELSWVN